MKKHLIAIALAGAFAGTASAQNVTLTGTLDHGIASSDLGTTTTTTTRGNTVGTSALKINVTEDLGGGLKFIGLLSQEIILETGAHCDTATNSTTAAYSNPVGSNLAANSFQESSIALSHAEFGLVKFGHFTLASRDASGVGRFMGNLGRLSGALRTNGDKVDNGVEYTTPKLANAVTVSVGVANQGSASAASATPHDSGFLVRFDQGAFSASLGQSRRDHGLTTGDNVETVFGAQFDAGIAKFGLVRGTDNGQSAAAAGTSLTRLTGTTGQVVVPLGQGLNLFGGMSKYKNTDSTVDASGYTLALSKDLSKRTTVRVYVDSLDNKGTVLVSTSTTGVAGKKTSNTGVNVTHNF